MVQKRVADCQSSTELNDQLLLLSRHYRAVITAQIMHLQQARRAKLGGDPKVAKEYENQIQLFQIANIVWHLAEIFLVSSREVITAQLVDWLNLHFDVPSEQLSQVIEYPQPELHPQYWPLLYKYNQAVILIYQIHCQRTNKKCSRTSQAAFTQCWYASQPAR